MVDSSEIELCQDILLQLVTVLLARKFIVHMNFSKMRPYMQNGCKLLKRIGNLSNKDDPIARLVLFSKYFEQDSFIMEGIRYCKAMGIASPASHANKQNMKSISNKQ